MELEQFSCEGLSVTAQGPVLRAHIDRGEGNPVSMAICRNLTRLLNDPPEAAHVLILSSGGTAFCTGRDRGAVDPAGLAEESEILIGLNEAIEGSRLVTIARVHGDAGGFGAGMAALSDVTIAVRGAKFFFPEAKIGLAPAVVLAWLPRLVGRRAAFWMTATAEAVSGDELVRLGLVNRLVSDAPELDAAIDETVAALTSKKKRNHAEIKAMLRDFEGIPSEKVNRMASSRLIVGALRRGDAD